MDGQIGTLPPRPNYLLLSLEVPTGTDSLVHQHTSLELLLRSKIVKDFDISLEQAMIIILLRSIVKSRTDKTIKSHKTDNQLNLLYLY